MVLMVSNYCSCPDSGMLPWRQSTLPCPTEDGLDHDFWYGYQGERYKHTRVTEDPCVFSLRRPSRLQILNCKCWGNTAQEGLRLQGCRQISTMCARRKDVYLLLEALGRLELLVIAAKAGLFTCHPCKLKKEDIYKIKAWFWFSCKLQNSKHSNSNSTSFTSKIWGIFMNKGKAISDIICNKSFKARNGQQQ